MSGESLDVVLADLAVLGDPDTLRAQAEAVLRADGAEPRRAAHYDGTDETGSVRVTVDPGGRVSDVVVRPSWTVKLGAERLAGGVYGAYIAAVRKAMAVEAATREDRPATAPSDAGWPRLPTPGEADFDAWLAGVGATVAEANARLHALPAPEPLPDEEFRSPNGYFTLRLRAGGLTDIDGNATALRWADHELVHRDVMAVFRDAGLTESRHDTADRHDETNEDLGVLRLLRGGRMDGFDIVPDTVRTEAKKWQEHSDAVEPVRDAVAGARLEQSAFWCGDPLLMSFDVAVHANAYEQFRGFVENLLKGAVAEFDEVHGALVRTAELYEHQDEISYEKLAEIYGEK